MKRQLFIPVVGLLLLASNAFAGGGTDANQLLPTAKGRTGPVGLELTLLRNKIKVGERLFVKTALTNYSTSKDQMAVADWIYRGSRDLSDVWTIKICDLKDPYIEIRDSKGHRLKPEPYEDLVGGGCDNPFCQTYPPVDAETQRYLTDLESQGLSIAQISVRLRKREEEKIDKKYPAIFLKQGQSVESVSWCAGRTAEKTPTAITCPGNGFVELANYSFDRPGRYRVRAVNDDRTPKELLKWTNQWSVRTATDWITFEVSR